VDLLGSFAHKLDRLLAFICWHIGYGSFVHTGGSVVVAEAFVQFGALDRQVRVRGPHLQC